MIEFVWLIPTVMLLAALVNGLGCRTLGKAAGYIAVAAMASTFVMACFVFLEVRHTLHAAEETARSLPDLVDRMGAVNAAFASQHTVTLWTWFEFPGFLGTDVPLKVDFAFRVDPLTSVFLLFISFIGAFVFLYATGYMAEKHDGHEVLDPGFARFFSYVSLFAAMMYILVLAGNMVVMFIGWEGVGLCSYLLIGYFFDKPFSETLSCADAGRKAFVMNRIGDFGLMLGMFIIFWGLGTVDFAELTAILASGTLPNGDRIPQQFLYGGGLITASALLLFLGATGKSAQIPLFTWLPDAMAGPTPVSALIHAATMVTAGVYMVARLNVLYMNAPVALGVVAIVGALTAFTAAYAGLTQRGIKKALAYSTVSQLGYMFLAMGVGAFAAGIFHVFTHAFFKGCLFLCAGSVIHALHHEEDMHRMGGLRKHMPITAMCYFIATLCIAGIPLTSGFFSKDEILYMAWLSKGEATVPVLYLVGIATAIMTAIYMGRTYYLTFEGPFRFTGGHGHDSQGHGHDDHGHAHHDAHGHHAPEVHESPRSMTVPLMVLAGLGLVAGFLNVPKGLIPLGGANAMFHHFIAPVTDFGAVATASRLYADVKLEEAPYGPEVLAGTIGAPHGALELVLAAVSGIVALLCVFVIARGLYKDGPARELAWSDRLWFRISLARWWWDDAYSAVFKNGTWNLSLAVWRFDMKIIDGAVNGVGALARRAGEELRRFHNGQTQVYGLVMLLGVVVFVLYFALNLARFLGSEPSFAQARHYAPAPAASATVAAAER
jgi:NADH-quinone oxidoreductase subunit L